jgi:L-histidine Nalpha-methyltransferase
MLNTPVQARVSEFAGDVCRGLSATPKELPAKYFYDEVGSALYEAITYLPEYGLTNADIRLLEKHARHAASRMAPGFAVVELGSGSGRKTRPVLEAAWRSGRMVRYFPIDLSASALENCRLTLGDLACVEPVLAPFLDGLERVREEHREPHLVLFVGSSIGNFNPEDACEFLTRVRATLNDSDALLLGVDLVKDERLLVQAYDDPAGVTAAFNLNLLARINRELGGNFDPRSFSHEARYCDDPPRVEMHLRATRACEVQVEAAGITCRFEKGETILTEKSHKYTESMLDALVTEAGFSAEARWIDDQWPFAELFLRPA